MKEKLTPKKVAEIIQARYDSESPKELTAEDEKVVAERLKKIEEYGKKQQNKAH